MNCKLDFHLMDPGTREGEGDSRGLQAIPPILEELARLRTDGLAQT
jgi:hypothetical protein